MLYCTKCGSLNEQAVEKCAGCGSRKALREANADDYIRLHNADQYTAGLLEKDFDAANIEHRIEPLKSKGFSQLYDSEVMPTDKSIYVRYADLDQAKELSAALKQKIQDEQEPPAEDNMSPRKRLVIQIVSVALFLALITVVVLLSDFFANNLKEFFEGLFSGGK